MCGIAGILASHPEEPASEPLLRMMTRRLAHRGPDGEGVFCKGPVGLGHRRLSIIDLAGGAQPITDPETGCALSFNGEIYNFLDLRAQLEGLGHPFRTQSDTEVLLRAWIEWGEEALVRLKGMFAFALWDPRAGRLFLAVDRLGKKPVYYGRSAKGAFYFGSELKALDPVLDLNRDLDPTAVADFFALGYIPHPKSIFVGIKKLKPAHLLVLEPGGALQVSAYWRVTREQQDPLSPEAMEEEVRTRFDAAVRQRMISDVPLGAFLSGGVDSSAVVAAMSLGSSDPVRSFAIGFGGGAADETPFAESVSRRYQTDHTTEHVAPRDVALIDRLAEVYDEPFGDNSALPTFQVCGVACSRVTVALSGDGGDELFAGYRRYGFHLYQERLRARMPTGLRQGVFGPLGRYYPKLDWAPRFLRAKTTFQELALDEADGLFQGVSLTSSALRQRLFHGDLVQSLGEYEPSGEFRDHLSASPFADPLARAQDLDLATWLAGGILTKVDRASMAHGLEVRSPLLDTDLLSWSLSLPASAKIGKGGGKALFKRAMEPRLPSEILYRQKQGFSLPLAAWLRGDLRGRVEALGGSPLLREAGLFSSQAIAETAQQHLSGRANHDRALWLLLVFEGFLRLRAERSNAELFA